MSDSRVVRLSDYSPLRDSLEWVFNAPYTTINAAVYHAITLRMARRGVLAPHDETAGATRYPISFITGEMAWIYVLQRGDAITTIQVHPVTAQGDDMNWSQEALDELGVFIRDCQFEATRAIRYTHPHYGFRPVESITPAMPNYQIEGWRSVFLWHMLHVSAMTDEELAAAQGVSLQTVYNMRSKLNAQRRQLKNLPGSKTHRKVSKKK